MAITTVAELKMQLNITATDDDALLSQKIDSAQDHIERLLGYGIEETYPDSVPSSLKEAVLQLASWWYEQREAAIAGVSARTVPHGVHDIVQEYRSWSFASDA